jgi:hypothetical protein
MSWRLHHQSLLLFGYDPFPRLGIEIHLWNEQYPGRLFDADDLGPRDSGNEEFEDAQEQVDPARRVVDRVDPFVHLPDVAERERC